VVAKPTSGETAVGALTGPEEFRIALSGNNYKVTATQIKAWASDTPTLVSPAITSTATMDMVATRTIAMQSFNNAVGRFYYYDNFHYAALPGVDVNWVRRTGTDPQAVITLGTSFGGGIVLTSGDDVAATMAVNGAQLSGPPAVRAGSGGGTNKITFAFQTFIGDITNVCIFCGLSDQNAALEMPFTLAAADALTSNATDAVGILFDTAAATDNLWLVGVKTDVDATKQNTGAAPVTNAHQLWRIEIDVAGAATFFLNDVQGGTAMANAVALNVSLYATFAVFSRTTASKTLFIAQSFLAQWAS
jgi:hypothetical protein